jgi:azurin
VLPKSKKVDDALMNVEILLDVDPKVVLSALLYFSEREPMESLGEQLYTLSLEEQVINDEWLKKATYIAASKHKKGFLKAFAEANPTYKIQKKQTSKVSKKIFEGTTIAELLIKNSEGVELLFKETSDSNENISRIHIKTIKNEMKYDVTEFVVEANTQVELVFENTDFMQHNLVITKRGAKEKVGLAADKLASDPKGSEKNYVPEMDEVLIATGIINPEEKAVLKFTAPSEPGLYPFICTFPGHWKIMQGTMKVVRGK